MIFQMQVCVLCVNKYVCHVGNQVSYSTSMRFSDLQIKLLRAECVATKQNGCVATVLRTYVQYSRANNSLVIHNLYM